MWTNNKSGGSAPPVSASVVFLTGLAILFGYYAYETGRLSENNLIFFAVLIPSVIIHEISHGWLANAFGDPTAKNAGRLTINPLRHIDPFGTLILPAVLMVLSGTAFGYAKPVPVNTMHMSRNKAMFVGLVGPFTNIVIAVLAALAIQVVYESAGELTLRVLFQLGIANVVLAVFNLIPIPPLDGSSVVERFLPESAMEKYLQLRQYAMFFLIFIMFSGALNLSRVFDPAIRLWAQLLPGGA